MKIQHCLFGIMILCGGLMPAYSQNAADAVRIVENELGIGARALAMGGAYVGLTEGYSAIYWNPAGLASMKRPEFFGEMSHLNFDNDAVFQQAITSESQDYTRLRSLGLAFPLPTTRGSFVVALGFNRVKDFDQNLLFSGFNSNSNGLSFTVNDSDFLFDKDVFQTEQITDEGGLNQWSVGAAIALSPNFTAGLTAFLWDGKDDYQFSFLQEDRQNIYNPPADFDRYVLNRSLNTDYTAVGLKVGGLVDMKNGLKLGGVVSFPVRFNVTETFAANDNLVFDDNTEDPFDFPAGQFEYDVKTPFQFDGGASYSNRIVTLAAGVRYRDWSQTRFDVPDNALSNPDFVQLLEENQIIRQDYRGTVQYNFGGEVYIENLRTKLRGGYAMVPSPLDNAPSDLDKTFISGGIGLMVDRFVSLDLTYLRGSWKQLSEDEFTPGGTLEDITTNKVLVGLTYRF